MAIALQAVGAFAQFLDNPSGVLPQASLNPNPMAQTDDDLTVGDLAYLTDDALPDPAAACIIGVVDDAIPFAHERLRLANGASRVAAVWIQDARWQDSSPGRDLPSGVEVRGARLTKLLRQTQTGATPDEDAIYRATGAIDMTHDVTPSAAFAAGHGAAVALEAAGFEMADPKARDHPVIAVSLPTRITADSMGTLATLPLMAAILFIVNRARRLCRQIERRKPDAAPVRLPLVINISLGLTAGSRDGTSILERFMDALSQHGRDDLGQIHFVLPTGNHRQSRLCARLRPGQDIGWRLPPDDPTINAIEIWGPRYRGDPRGDAQITLTLPGRAPATTRLTRPWQYSVLRMSRDGPAVARAYYTPNEVSPGEWRDGFTIIALPTCPEKLAEPFAPPGEWRIGIAAASPAEDYEVTIQRDEVIRGFRREARQSWLHDPAYRRHDAAEWPVLSDEENGGQPLLRRRGTVNAYACGAATIRAGAVYHHPRTKFQDRLDTDENLPTDYCSHLADGKGGDIVAKVDQSVLHGYAITRGRISGSFALSSGTSIAAPSVTRWLAGQLASGAVLPDRRAIRVAAGASNTVLDAPPPILGENVTFPAF